jgi:hypothetical protein
MPSHLRHMVELPTVSSLVGLVAAVCKDSVEDWVHAYLGKKTFFSLDC